MRKPESKRTLTLHTQTLRRLSTHDLVRIVGGGEEEPPGGRLDCTETVSKNPGSCNNNTWCAE